MTEEKTDKNDRPLPTVMPPIKIAKVAATPFNAASQIMPYNLTAKQMTIDDAQRG